MRNFKHKLAKYHSLDIICSEEHVMSKKKQKLRIGKEVVRHDFSHLTKTKTAAKVVAAEEEVSYDAVSPLDTQVRRDLRVGLIVIGAFVVAIVALWLLVGRTGWLYNATSHIKWF